MAKASFMTTREYLSPSVPVDHKDGNPSFGFIVE